MRAHAYWKVGLVFAAYYVDGMVVCVQVIGHKAVFFSSWTKKGAE